MKRTFTILLLLASLSILFTQKTIAQEEGSGNKLFKNMSVNANFGSLLFYGDIRQYDFYPVMENNSEWAWGGGLSVNKTLNPIIGVQGQFLYGGLKGTKRQSKTYFNTQLLETNLQAVINLSNILFVTKSERKTTIYGFVGLGLLNFRSQAKNLKTDAILRDYGYVDGTEDKDKMTTETVVPMGLGFKFRINTNLDFNIESSIRNVNSDKLDATVKEGTADDKYGYTAVGITYKFVGTEQEDLDWQNPLEANELGGSQAKIEGLTKDTDMDGVVDFFDQEPATPEGISVDGSGRSLDVDGDGVPDYLDADPFTTKGATVDENGLELDDDEDGVPNSRDLENNTEKGAIVNFQGISIDKASKSAGEEFATGINTSFLPSIYFGVGTASITAYNNGPHTGNENVERLAVVAQVLKSKPDLQIKVIGHASKTGSKDFNLKLSKDRAQNVIDYLVKVYDMPAERFVLEFKGDNEPLAKELNYINRRVDFVPQKK